MAAALAASAGVEEVAPAIEFSSREDFERDFPRLAAATEAERQNWRSGEGEAKLVRALSEFAHPPDDFFLLADAMGIIAFLFGSVEARYAREEGLAEVDAVLVPGRLGELARMVLW